jgi:catechol 2,3-dioxygenase-like lactoylglutathione lyase family enzyme
MSDPGIVRTVDAVSDRVPDIDAGIHYYVRVLDPRVKWRNNAMGRTTSELPDGESERGVLVRCLRLATANGAIAAIVGAA